MTDAIPEIPNDLKSESAKASIQRVSSARRWWLPLTLGISVFIALSSAAAFIPRPAAQQESSPQTTHTITRGELVVTVLAKGSLESSRNTEIKCRVRGGYGGRGGESTVISVIPAGSFVEKDDVLVRLDTKVIEETISLGKTDTNNAKAALARAEADLARAEISVDSYLNGSYRSQLQQLEKELDEKKRNLRISEKMLEHSDTMFQRGYVTKLEVEGNQYVVTRAQLELNVIETRIDVLSRLTKAMQLETLNGQLISTKARMEGRKAGLALEQSRLDLAIQELDNCVIRAPRSGLVIYPSTAKWKDTPDITVGASVRNNQVLLIMPDLSQMQVVIGIHESIVDQVQPGMDTKVTLPDRTLDTKVFSVAPVASPAGWWTGNTVNYDAVIQLPAEQGLKPGMSAEVEIVVARHLNVLSVPVHAIVESKDGHFCWVKTANGTERRTLELGDSNDQFVVVQSGLRENEKVVLDPTSTVAEAKQMVSPSPVQDVARGDLIVSLTEQGSLESSNNTPIKCRVQGSSTVNWVIESGTEVKAGDELVRLENKQIEEALHERTKYAFLSKDAAIGFRAHANRAELAIAEYLEGRYLTELMTLEKNLAIAEERRGTAENMLRHARRMFDRGYVSQIEVEQKEFAVKEAKMQVEIHQTDIDVLERFTKLEEIATLRGNWESAKAAADGHEEVFKMDEARIRLAREEMKRSVIRADRDGLVIYPNGEEWKDTPDVAEGVTVHYDQVLLLMPNLTQMQAKIGVHESMVDEVKPGMSATVTVPGKTLRGKVVSVAAAAQPAGWWTGNVAKYDAIIQLPSEEGLKPGMSAEVEILMARHDNVLMIPLAAVEETDEGSFCWVGTPSNAQRRSVQLGESSDTFVIVEDGLQEGEQIVIDPSTFRRVNEG